MQKDVYNIDKEQGAIMKKLFILLSVLVFCICVKAEGDAFIDALRNCLPLHDSDIINVNGINAKSVKQISGWQDGKCTYKETVNFGGNNVATVCKFTKPQIHEIVSVADAYALTQKYSQDDIDLTSTDAVKNNPVVNVLSKYLQDPSVCSMDME